jgi:hypothetical protein
MDRRPEILSETTRKELEKELGRPLTAEEARLCALAEHVLRKKAEPGTPGT